MIRPLKICWVMSQRLSIPNSRIYVTNFEPSLCSYMIELLIRAEDDSGFRLLVIRLEKCWYDAKASFGHALFGPLTSQAGSPAQLNCPVS